MASVTEALPDTPLSVWDRQMLEARASFVGQVVWEDAVHDCGSGRWWRYAPEQTVNCTNLARPIGSERRASGLVGNDREALRVCDWDPVLGEGADFVADDDG